MERVLTKLDKWNKMKEITEKKKVEHEQRA